MMRTRPRELQPDGRARPTYADPVRTLTVVEYDPAWPALYERLRASIWPVVADVAVAIEHVGSTAVPGLAAKPIVDLDVVVRSRTDVPTAVGRITTLGYDHLGDLGIVGREAGLPQADLDDIERANRS
jgi:GrpB-like predicted nucleotidyltransferase (UPF0157 family)